MNLHYVYKCFNNGVLITLFFFLVRFSYKIFLFLYNFSVHFLFFTLLAFLLQKNTAFFHYCFASSPASALPGCFSLSLSIGGEKGCPILNCANLFLSLK